MTTTMTSNSTSQDSIRREETHDLISSEKVDGTTVYDPNGDKLGTVKQVMIGKRDGKVRYAVLSFGGLFGMGERYHPLPWDSLTYDEDQGGYVVRCTRAQLEGGPSYERGQEPEFDRTFGDRINSHYGMLR